MNITDNDKNSYYYRQLAAAYRDCLPNGTTGRDLQNAVSAVAGGIGLGFGFGIASLFFSQRTGAATLSSLARKFSPTRPLPFFPAGAFLSFATASAIENGTDNLLQSKSVQKNIREKLAMMERDSHTFTKPSGETISIAIKDAKNYKNDHLYKIIFEDAFDPLIKNPLYIQEKEQMLEHIEKACKGFIPSESILKKLNKDTQPSKGLCIGMAINWAQYLFQNGVESVLTRDPYAFENLDTAIHTTLFQKINHITSLASRTSSVPRLLSSALDIPQEKIRYFPSDSFPENRSNKITEETLHFLLKQHEGKIVCLACSKEAGGHAICTGSFPEKDLRFIITNSRVFFFDDLESLCRAVLVINADLCQNTRIDYLLVVDQ